MKKLFLFLLIIVPVAIYLFFKYFGTNTYQIPVYYAEGVESELCGIYIGKSYRVSIQDSVMNDTYKNKMFLFYVHSDLNQNLEMMLREIERNVLAKHSGDIAVIGLFDATNSNKINGVYYVSLSNPKLLEYVNCNLLVSEQSNDLFNFIVLVDPDRSIRGYYNGHEFDEYDRLAAELDILRLEER